MFSATVGWCTCLLIPFNIWCNIMPLFLFFLRSNSEGGVSKSHITLFRLEKAVN